MTKALLIKKGTSDSILDFLHFLLETKKVQGVFSLKKIQKEKAVVYSLITNPDDLKDAVPFYPIMPVNAGKLLSRFTLKGPAKKPIVAVAKPCELRGFIELIKREQGSCENLYTISATCGGVFPLKRQVENTIEKNLPEYWKTVQSGEISGDIRPVCQACEEFVPYTADITIDLLGNRNSNNQCLMITNTKQGQNLITGMKGKPINQDLDTSLLDKIRDKRFTEKKQLFADIDKKMDGIDGLINIFSKCIGCHGCSKVCPICYCTLCEFESPDAEYSPATYSSELKRRGGIRVPPGTLFYHLGRLTHIGISCVSCGQCSDVCPVDIPVSLIFKKVGESVQDMFKYIPGKDADEAIPLVTFEKEEFSEIEG
jgi:formate dehydrogenase subunit beta